MQQFNNFRAGDVPVSYMLQGMFQQLREEASPACVAGCAEPCVRNPPKGAVSLLLFTGSPHTPGSEWEQGRIPLGYGGGTWPWSLPATLLREWGQTPPCQGKWGRCLGAAKGHREHPAASPSCSHSSLSTLCPQSTTNTFHVEAEAVTSPAGAGAPEPSCQCVGPGTSLTLFAGRASAAHRGCRC